MSAFNIKIMHFASFLRVEIILRMSMSRKSWSSLHQGEKQPAESDWSKLQDSRNVGIPRMELDTKKNREIFIYITNFSLP